MQLVGSASCMFVAFSIASLHCLSTQRAGDVHARQGDCGLRDCSRKGIGKIVCAAAADRRPAWTRRLRCDGWTTSCFSRMGSVSRCKERSVICQLVRNQIRIVIWGLH